jgi:YVTN family beta-propeller protein
MANDDGDSVSVINTTTNTVVATVNVGFSPLDVAIGSIQVSEPVLPVANFSAKPTSGIAPLTVCLY